MKYLLVLCLGLLSNPVWACDSQSGTCDYYECISTKMNCDADNYLTTFAKPYCQKFIDIADQFSPKGQKFLTNVKNCLLAKVQMSAFELKCSDIAETAADHHVECYTRFQVCELSFIDRWLIFETVAFDVFVPPFSEAVGKIVLACLDSIEMAFRTEKLRQFE